MKALVSIAIVFVSLSPLRAASFSSNAQAVTGETAKGINVFGTVTVGTGETQHSVTVTCGNLVNGVFTPSTGATGNPRNPPLSFPNRNYAEFYSSGAAGSGKDLVTGTTYDFQCELTYTNNGNTVKITQYASAQAP